MPPPSNPIAQLTAALTSNRILSREELLTIRREIGIVRDYKRWLHGPFLDSLHGRSSFQVNFGTDAFASEQPANELRAVNWLLGTLRRLDPGFPDWPFEIQRVEEVGTKVMEEMMRDWNEVVGVGQKNWVRRFTAKEGDEELEREGLVGDKFLWK